MLSVNKICPQIENLIRKTVRNDNGGSCQLCTIIEAVVDRCNAVVVTCLSRLLSFLFYFTAARTGTRALVDG